MADEEIRLQLSLLAEEFTNDVLRARGEVDALKEAMVALAIQSGISLKEASESMKNILNELKAASLDTSGIQRLISELPKAYAEAQKPFDDAIKQQKQAKLEQVEFEKQLAEILKSLERDRLTESMRLSSQRAKFEKQQAGEILAYEKQVMNEQEQFERDLAKVLKSIKDDQLKEDQKRSKQKADFWREEAKLQLQAEKQTKGTASAFEKLGSAMQLILGLGLIQFFRQLINTMKELAAGGVEFAQALFRLGASVRALQRLGMDITMAETVEQIEELRKSFSFFTTKEIVTGIGQIQLLSRNFEFTKDEMKDTMEIATALAIVQGKDLGESARQLALFFSSGYAEALQRAGFAVNRLTIQEQAHRDGLDKNYTALTEVERAHAALNLVRDQAKPIVEELTKYEESLAGQLVESQKAIEEQKNMISLKLTPAYNLWLKIQNLMINALNIYLGIWQKLGAGLLWIAREVLPPHIAAWQVLQEVIRGNIDEFDDLGRVWKAKTAEMKEAINELREDMTAFDLWDLAGADYTGPTLPKPDETAEIWEKFFDDAVRGAYDIQQEYNERMLDAEQDFLDEMGWMTDSAAQTMIDTWSNYFSENGDISDEEFANLIAQAEASMGEYGSIMSEALEEVLEIWRDYWAELDQINEKEAQSILDAQIDLQRDLEDLEIDTQRRIQDAQRRYRETELKAERDFQEKMRRLREEFLFDLEDALRERDAKQVLQLIRRYKLDVEQAKRQYEEEAEERRIAFQNELEDIRLQEQRKREDLLRAHEQRLADIAAQAERERQQAEEDRKQAIDELKADLEKEREEVTEEYEKTLQEIADALEKAIQELAKSLWEEYEEIAGKDGFLEAMITAFKTVFGDEGPLATSVDGLNTIVETAVKKAQEEVALLEQLAINAQALANQISASLAAVGPWPLVPTAYPGPWPIVAQQQGGTFLATRPTMALYGEAGPELVTFTPLNRIQSQAGPNTSAPGLGGGMSVIKLLLSPGLEAQIVDNAMGQMADVIIERIR